MKRNILLGLLVLVPILTQAQTNEVISVETQRFKCDPKIIAFISHTSGNITSIDVQDEGCDKAQQAINDFNENWEGSDPFKQAVKIGEGTSYETRRVPVISMFSGGMIMMDVPNLPVKYYEARITTYKVVASTAPDYPYNVPNPPFELDYPDSDINPNLYNPDTYNLDLSEEEYKVDRAQIDEARFQRQRESCAGEDVEDVQGCFKVDSTQTHKKSFP